jgi:methylenetetrahydrofolate reductase (NADPH)
MAKVTDKIAAWKESNLGKPWFSFEYFPPKTELGCANLYERFDRMSQCNPMWVDVTWGAGGSTADKTLEICINALKYHGLDVMMHLTCTNMEKEALHRALTTCKENGICNILALRGDPPAGVNAGEWKAVEGGFAYAVDLVKYIREEFGDYFCIAVAGYPEGHLEMESKDADLRYLKEKVDAGADMIVTQLFYDNGEFFAWRDKCVEMGITIPILPGIMPIQSYGGFTRMTSLCKTKLPPTLMEDLEPIKDDDQKVKDFGVQLAVRSCQELVARGTPGLHFYTLNLETSVMRIIKGLGLIDELETRELPWKQSAEKKRRGEDVRPIFWANRPQSYFRRTATWDEFPNGRFGNAASPAFGDHMFVSYSQESTTKLHAERREMWGTPTTVREVANVFIGYLRGTVKRLPWCEGLPAQETGLIMKQLLKYNELGLLTINSQPRVNGALSTDPYVGWGPLYGFVYQKAYLEFFCSPETLEKLMRGVETERLHFLSYTAVNKAEDVKSNTPDDRSVNAVTWGIFPGKEVVQPTVVDTQSFMAWKDEAFQLWHEWGQIYDKASPSGQLLETIQNTWYLVYVVDNNFVAGDLLTDVTRILQA